MKREVLGKRIKEKKSLKVTGSRVGWKGRSGGHPRTDRTFRAVGVTARKVLDPSIFFEIKFLGKY